MIPEELRHYIGKTDTPYIKEDDKGTIKRYAQAVGNDNPLYKNDEYAGKSIFSGVMLVSNFDTTYLNQNGDLVAKAYQTFIAR